MKKSGTLIIAFVGILVLFAAFIKPTDPVPSNAPKGIPDSVWQVISKCCLDCHATDGNGMARANVDFDKWDSYTPDKQLAKAQDICNELQQGKMPPSKYRKNNPEGVPTESETARVCNWVRQMEK
ncbi:MAG: heme-binding domain-containing protein [Bacteroidales bacterium]|nr:heme-binding domain-containing protein [Bacteroidales bacterium]